MIWRAAYLIRNMIGLRWPYWLYEAYICSGAWRRIRRQVMLRANGLCEMCGRRTIKFDVHHVTYDRLGRELPEDLLAICRPCHESVHELRRI